MTSLLCNRAVLLCNRAVDVHILFRSKFNGRKIWAEEECSTCGGGTEATLKQVRSDVYVMEINARGGGDSPKVVLEIDFRKVKSYTMRATCWHEVKYDGRLIALRFTENETFDEFFKALERVLRIYRKFTKPKNDVEFLREVEMFQLKQLKPVETARRTVSLETTGQETPSETLQGGKTRVKTQSRSLDIFQRNRLPCREPAVNKKQVEMQTNKSPPQPLQKPKKSSAPNRLPPHPKPKPGRSPPPTVPPPRMSGGDIRNARSGFRGSWSERTETQERTSDTSNEESDVEANTLDCSAGPMINDEAVESTPPSPPLPRRTNSRASTVSSISELTESPLPQEEGDTRWRRQSSNNHEVSDSSPVNQRREMPKDHDPTTILPGTLSQGPRGKRPPKDNKTPSTQLPKPQKDPKRIDTPPRPRPTHPPTPSSSPAPIHPAQSSSSDGGLYGTAMAWVCSRCTLRNDLWRLNCAACDWLRTDAWGCIACATVYSSDVTRCFTCNVWRCQLCTFINRGEQNEKTLCQGCEQ